MANNEFLTIPCFDTKARFLPEFTSAASVSDKLPVITVLMGLFLGGFHHSREPKQYTGVSGESSDPISIDTTVTVEAGRYIQLIGRTNNGHTNPQVL